MIFAALYVNGVVLIFNILFLLLLAKSSVEYREIIFVLAFADIFALILSAIIMLRSM